jgi:hypothetical protein
MAWHDADHSPPSSTEVKNELGAVPPLPTSAFIALTRNSFAFALYHQNISLFL